MPVWTRLQGSYRNSTNIRGDSDVDVLASWERIPESKLVEGDADSEATALRHWSELRQWAIAALREEFGPECVSLGDKSIKLASTRGLLGADIVPCLDLEYRGDPDAIAFPTSRSGQWIINYPKAHYENGVGKNDEARTASRYKAGVRVLKNARSLVVQSGAIEGTRAPSYFLECFLYNAPDALFKEEWKDYFPMTLDWMSDAICEPSSLICQNGLVPLFGVSPQQWSVDSAIEFIAYLMALWNGWDSP